MLTGAVGRGVIETHSWYLSEIKKKYIYWMWKSYQMLFFFFLKFAYIQLIISNLFQANAICRKRKCPRHFVGPLPVRSVIQKFLDNIDILSVHYYYYFNPKWLTSEAKYNLSSQVLCERVHSELRVAHHSQFHPTQRPELNMVWKTLQTSPSIQGRPLIEL